MEATTRMDLATLEPRDAKTAQIVPDPEAGPIDPRNSRLYHTWTFFRSPIGAMLKLVNALGPATVWVRTFDREGRCVSDRPKQLAKGETLICPARLGETVEVRMQKVFGGMITGNDHRQVEQEAGLPDLSKALKEAQSRRT